MSRRMKPTLCMAAAMGWRGKRHPLTRTNVAVWGGITCYTIRWKGKKVEGVVVKKHDYRRAL